MRPTTSLRKPTSLLPISPFSAFLVTFVTVAVIVAVPATAQSSSVFATGLLSPTKIALTPGGELLVAEGGTFTPNTGRLSVLDRDGNRRTLLDGLPSGPEPAGQPQGPSGMAFAPSGRLLFVLLAAGDVTAPGPAPGQDAPNPQGPSSPILSSVLAVRLSTPIEDLASGFTLTLDDHFEISHGRRVTLTNSEGETAGIRLVHDFRDLVRDPVTNVRRFNPFGIALDPRGRVAWVVDSSQDSLERVSLRTDRDVRVLKFDPVPNPLPFGPPLVDPLPFGPPLVDPVPTSVRLFRGGLLVSLETGFPFGQGVAAVLRVDLREGTTEEFIGGLTQALDVLPVRGRGPGTEIFVVELSLDLLSVPPAPGRLLRFTDPAGPPEILADTLAGPTSVAVDPVAGEAFVTEVFTGNVVRVTLP